MAGTDSTKAQAADLGPAVVLVEPQMGENIGFAARAMLNCGLEDLRLVRPRDGWPNPKSLAAASGADGVIDGARGLPTKAAAVADRSRVLRTTARNSDKNHTVQKPR